MSTRLSARLRQLTFVGGSVAAVACSDVGGEINGCAIVSQYGDWSTGTQESWEYYPVIDSEDNRCPIAILSPGEEVVTGGYIWGIRQGIEAPTERAHLTISNSRGILVADNVQPFFRASIEQIETDVFVSYPAITGHGTFSERDLLDLRINDYCCPLPKVVARMSLHLDYKPDLNFAQVGIYGNEIPRSSAIETWVASSPSSGRPHSYRWYRDGSYVGSGDRYAASASTSDFTLRVEMTDTHQRTASNSFDVDVDGVRVTMDGPEIVYASAGGGAWTASGRGGSTPYTYDWYVDGQWVGRGASWSGYPGEYRRTLQVRVRDAAGASDSASTEVTGLGSADGGCTPEIGKITCAA